MTIAIAALAHIVDTEKKVELLFKRITKEIVERRETGYVKPEPVVRAAPVLGEGTPFFQLMMDGVVMDLATEHFVSVLNLVPAGEEPTDEAMIAADSVIAALHSSGYLTYDRVDSREIVRWSDEIRERYTA